jgi:hypothetical protein
MKKIILLITIIFIFGSCAVKKSTVSTLVQKDSTSVNKSDSLTSHKSDSLIVRARIINQAPITLNNDINLNTLDLFKQYYSQSHPLTTYDSTGQTRLDTYIDSNNHLQQKVTTKPKPVIAVDTTKISHSNQKEVKATDTNKSHSSVLKTDTVIEKQPSFFERVWSTIKSFIWFIVIGAVIFILYKLNIIGLIKKLFIK